MSLFLLFRYGVRFPDSDGIGSPLNPGPQGESMAHGSFCRRKIREDRLLAKGAEEH